MAKLVKQTDKCLLDRDANILTFRSAQSLGIFNFIFNLVTGKIGPNGGFKLESVKSTFTDPWARKIAVIDSGLQVLSNVDIWVFLMTLSGLQSPVVYSIQLGPIENCVS